MTLYQRHGDVTLHEPVLVLATEGWVDAGVGAAGALAVVLPAIDSEVVATFDTDELLDHRARRPTVRIENGRNTGLRWPELELRAGRAPGGRDVLVLTGPEPDHRWRQFTAEVVGLSAELGVGLVVGLGAFPAPVPHTRPVRLAATATSDELAREVGFVPGVIEVPAGVHAALEQGFAGAGIPAVGLWARVPHYAAAMPYPAASAALIEGLNQVAGLALDPAELRAAAEITRHRIDELIAQSEDHQAMVAGLERQIDVDEPESLRLSELPTGDEIAAELERFLRGEGSP